jgi:hypothetical protein
VSFRQTHGNQFVCICETCRWVSNKRKTCRWETSRVIIRRSLGECMIRSSSSTRERPSCVPPRASSSGRLPPPPRAPCCLPPCPPPPRRATSPPPPPGPLLHLSVINPPQISNPDLHCGGAIAIAGTNLHGGDDTGCTASTSFIFGSKSDFDNIKSVVEWGRTAVAIADVTRYTF